MAEASNARSSPEYVSGSGTGVPVLFFFTPKGRILSLPRGATAVDFAYQVHTDIGNRCVAAKVNGELVPLRTELRNGDQVEILTSRAQTPSPTWERFVVSGKAKSAIRRFIRQKQRAETGDYMKQTFKT